MGLFGGSWVGLDIGSSSVKVVQLKTGGASPELKAAGLAEISPDAMEAVEEDVRDALVSETIRRLLKETKVGTKNVVTSISGEALIVRPVKLPFMSPEELDGMVPLEAEQYIPLPMDEVVLDYHVIGESVGESQRKLDVFLVAAKQEHVERHLSLVQGAGLVPKLIDVDAFACGNTFVLNDDSPAEETVMLISIGAARTSVDIVETREVKLTRDIGIGGTDFTKEIQREFNLSLGQAEELKKQQGAIVMESEDVSLSSLAAHDDRSMRISECINPVLNKLLAEIRRMTDFYETSGGQKAINRIVLTGGGSRLANLDRYFSDKLGVAVDILNPFHKVRMTGKGLDAEVLKTQASYFSVAMGLALRAFDPKKRHTHGAEPEKAVKPA